VKVLAAVNASHARPAVESRDAAADYQAELVAGFVLARAAHGVSDKTVRSELVVIGEFLDQADVWAWEVEPHHADQFLGNAHKDQAVATRRGKAGTIALFYRFLELRHQGEILALTGSAVTSPIDEINRPVHSGDFAVRIPPSARELADFFSRWREDLESARKWRNAARNYTMARLAAEVGLRAREVCLLSLDDLHFELGPIGKIHVKFGKGARGSGPRARVVPMLGGSRPLLAWWVGEVRGQFEDDWSLPLAPAFPSEREGPVDTEAFRSSLGIAARDHLHGPVRTLTPHVLRHACASHLYEGDMGLPAIQELLGHRWLTTTMGYVHVASETIEADYARAAQAAAARFGR